MARKPADQSVSRDDIITAAADVLHRSGYEATTMKDIAAAVNLTAASLYHHFKNKDALLLAVLEGGLDYALARIEPILMSDKTNAQKLREMTHVHIVGLTENTAVGAAMVFEIRALLNAKTSVQTNGQGHEIDEDFAARRDAFFVRRDTFEDSFRRVIREGVERGEFHAVDVSIFTKALLGAHNWVGVWYRPDGRLTGAQIADTMADTFLRSLLR